MSYLCIAVCFSMVLFCKAVEENIAPTCTSLTGQCKTKKDCGRGKDIIKVTGADCPKGEICCIANRQVCEAMGGTCDSEDSAKNLEGYFFFKSEKMCTDSAKSVCYLKTAAPDCENYGGKCEISNGDGKCQDTNSQPNFHGSCPQANQCCVENGGQQKSCLSLKGKCIGKAKKRRCKSRKNIAVEGACKRDDQICCMPKDSSQCDKMNGKCRPKDNNSAGCKITEEKIPTKNVCLGQGEMCCLPKKSDCEVIGGTCLEHSENRNSCKMDIGLGFCFSPKESCCMQQIGCNDVDGGMCIDKTIQPCNSANQRNLGKLDCVGEEQCCVNEMTIT